MRAILADVRKRGDAAVLDYTRKFDRIAGAHDRRTRGAARAARGGARGAARGAGRRAARGAPIACARFHERQLQQSWEYTEADGTRLGQRVTPLERVGVYVPGGKAAYPSSVLMNAIPAKVAGVGEIVMVSPQRASRWCSPRRRSPAWTACSPSAARRRSPRSPTAPRSVPRVDKIVGPGNAYVAAAKRQVFGEVGIDMIAGPSEILVIGDGTTPADWVAMDLFSQAEHDEVAQAILLSPGRAYLDAVEASIARLLPTHAAARRDRGFARGARRADPMRDLEEACAIANRIAPEHLELSVENPDALLPKLRHAGAIFLGRWSSEAIGDYCAGPNHVLPTSGTARFSSPLGVYDFQKRTSVIGVSRAGAATLGRIAATLADGEGLPAHARFGRDRGFKMNARPRPDPPGDPRAQGLPRRRRRRHGEARRDGEPVSAAGGAAPRAGGAPVARGAQPLSRSHRPRSCAR